MESDSTPSRALAATGIYALLAIALTWPLTAHLDGSRAPAGNNDLFQNLWNFWWWKESIFELGVSPYSTELLFGGQTTSLAFHTHSEANVAVTTPWWLTLGPVAANNLAVLLGFIIAAIGGYLLAFELWRSRRAAFLAGLVFGFFPQHFEQSLEHLNLSSYGAMALFLAFLVRGTREADWRAWILCALSFALNALFSWHNGLLILPAAVLIFVIEYGRTSRPRLRILLQAVSAGALATAVVAPFLWPMLREMLSGATWFQKPPAHRPIDLAFLGIPSDHHPLWGSWVAKGYDAWRRYEAVGFTGYLGWAPIAIIGTALGLRARQWLRGLGKRGSERERSPWLWLAVAAMHVILSLGRELRVAGEDTGVLLPFAALESAPLFSTLRVANRFIVPAMLGVSMLVAWGSARGFRIDQRSRWLFAVLAATLVTDFLWVPFPMRDLPAPRWIEPARGLTEGTLLNIPGGYRARAAEDMYLQTLHERPIVGGYASCTPPSVDELLARHPILQSIHEAERSPTYRDLPALEGLRGVLEDSTLGIAVVAVHLDRAREVIAARRTQLAGTPEERLHNPEKGLRRAKIDECRQAMRSLWGEPVWSDDATELFERPNASNR